MSRTNAVRDKFTNSDPTYQQLAQFNRHCADAQLLIEIFGKQQMIPQRECRYYSALLQELRALASQSVVEGIEQQEISRAASFGRLRSRLEKQLQK